ncbi:MAG: ABC transporter permease [Candidatus Roseilinea sp.]|uniref:ABC transporter permease n=1 Tax=Candidatus Roseilinea sp. TaxID=2838777 RepID=UPI00404B1815
MVQRTFPTREALRRLPFGLADIAILLGVIALIYLVAAVGAGALVAFEPPEQLPTISLDPANLPYYLARSTLRMFVAMGFSLGFTFVVGYIAASNRYAEQIIIPTLDVLQSVPVLGFLSVTVTGFIALFRGSLLGLEAASIFAIFTSQVWNMTFSFYHSLRNVPGDMQEAAAVYRLSRWARFIYVQAPAGMIGLVWNMVMSFGGGWFFVAASEAISVLNQKYTLPGIGAYVTEAIAQEDMRALLLAMLAMAALVVVIDQVMWRPLIAWADRFKVEQNEATQAPRSWMLELLRRSRVLEAVRDGLAAAGEKLLARSRRAKRARRQASPRRPLLPARWVDALFNATLLVIVAAISGLAIWFIHSEVGFEEILEVVLLGAATFARVVIIVIVSTLIWMPLGVAIGMNPRVARIAQPITQFLVTFPANFLFPFVTIFLIRFGISLDIGGIFLMALGSQWYILFNVIAGAQSIPNDLREMADNLRLSGWRRWQSLIIPAVFPAWVTGAITASGGAWNASIVAEIVSWGDTTLTATGLGAYIADATSVGDWPRIVLGVGMMSVFVVGLNRILWRRLYTLAETRYRL